MTENLSETKVKKKKRKKWISIMAYNEKPQIVT